ncbi:MAG: hypothetical protein JXB26_16795 [Candidatus Aminicenantes bacterium]|nr:hypothetical protein [Candidatus Aminicenantes bacterium]
MADYKKPIDEIIQINPPKDGPDLKIPGLHPLFWMGLQFIKKVPINKFPNLEDREKWEGFQKCATEAQELGIDLLQAIVKPIPDVDRPRIPCLNQPIDEIIDPPGPIVDPIKK